MHRPEPGVNGGNHPENGHEERGKAGDGDAVDERPRTYQPALPTLTRNVSELRARLLDGFADRRELLRWEQDCCVRTLGQVPQRFYEDIARSFRSGADDRTLLAVLLRDGVPGVDLPRDVARAERRRMAAYWVVPSFNSAFRNLRPNAKQYIEDAVDNEHDPDEQPHTAMRPALDELDDWQERALDACLTGFDSAEAILEWGDEVHLATHGEIPRDFITRCYTERATRRVLLDSYPGAESERELLCAHFVIPHMNAGVRELAKRAGELATSTQPDHLEVPSG